MSQNEIKIMYDVLIADIEVGERKRAINSEKVTALMQSIKTIGLQTPITVYGWPDDQKPCTLVAGLHRLEAVKRLGRDAIPAFITKANEIDREIWEIDENLMRAELTEIERGEHLKRRKEIFDARSTAEKIPTTPSKRGRIGEGHPKGFDQDTAEKTGMEKSTVRKSRSRAEKIVPEVKEAIKDMPAADSGVELDAIADLEPDEQVQAVKRVKSGASKDFREAKDDIKSNVTSVVDIEFERLQKAWRRAAGEARERFLHWINEPAESVPFARGATRRQRGVLAHNLYDGLNKITGLPDIETMIKATNKKHDVLTTKVPIAIDWLNDFAHALSERNEANGRASPWR